MPHNPTSTNIFLDPDLYSEYINSPLKSQIRKMIDEMKTRLLYDKFSGAQVQKNLIPKKYKRLDFTNLYVYDHSQGFRSCYTISNKNGFKGCPVILDLLSHEEYNRLFGYKKD